MRRHVPLPLVRLVVALACMAAAICMPAVTPRLAMAMPGSGHATLPATGDAVVPIAIGVIVVAVVVGIVIYNKRS